MSAVLEYLPRGNTLSDEAFRRRHRLLQVLLLLHLPGLFLFGLWRGVGVRDTAESLAVPLACLVLGSVLRTRRPASLFVTLGLVYCSAALVGLSGGSIEAHFHFFITIGFIALYQDWVPFLVNVLFTVLSHGIGSSYVPDLMFNHTAAQQNPWGWSLVHGVAVLAACVGVVLFWKTSEEEQNRSMRLTQELTDAEIRRRRFTSDLLVNLARRNQNLLYRQLDLINALEEKERDPDALGDLFRLDHLATRIRRNAENLLVLSGEETPRAWSAPVPLVDVVRAAIAEIENLDRADFAVDDELAVSGRVVADLTHLVAELLENAVHFSPPGVSVMVRSRPYLQQPGAHVLTIEDWGIGMTPAEMADANALLAQPRDVDLSVSQRLGLHVVARLAARHGTSVTLTPTPGGGVTAVVLLPATLFADPADPARRGAPVPAGVGAPSAGGGQRVLSGASPAPYATGAGAPPFVPPPAAQVAPAPPLAWPGLPEVPAADAGRPGPGALRNGDGALRNGDGAVRNGEVRADGGSAAPAGTLSPVLPAPRTSPEDAPETPSGLPRRSLGRAARDLDRPFGAPRGQAAAAPADAADDWTSWWTPRAADRPGTDGATPPPAPAPSTPDGAPAHAPAAPAATAAPAAPAAPAQAGTPASAAAPRAGAPAGPGGPGPVAPSTLDGAPSDVDGPTLRAVPALPAEPADGPRLNRRVPQAHLAAGLRREAQAQTAPAEPATPVRDPGAARDALSRFQASQRQAREAVRRGEVPDTSEGAE